MGKIITVLVIMLISNEAYSQQKLIEIDRLGHTGSIHQFYVENSMDEEDKKELPPRQTPREFYSSLLPIHTANMSPGDVSPEPRNLPRMMRPVFIIGSDAKSKQWLQSNKANLIKMNAAGLLVEVETIDQFEEIGRLGQGLQIAPTSGDQFASIVGLTHYPVLITRYGIEQ